MRRVLLNLLGNAAESLEAEEGGTIEMGYEIQGGQYRLFIRDNGAGIPEEIRDTLFEPFVTRGKTDGTGLGTAIARKIAEAHGGGIWFETETGVGTTFFVEFPFETG